MCTSLMGGFEHRIPDIRQRVGVAFTARSPIERLIEAKRARGWTNMPIFSDVSARRPHRRAAVPSAGSSVVTGPELIAAPGRWRRFRSL